MSHDSAFGGNQSTGPVLSSGVTYQVAVSRSVALRFRRLTFGINSIEACTEDIEGQFRNMEKNTLKPLADAAKAGFHRNVTPIIALSGAKVRKSIQYQNVRVN